MRFAEILIISRAFSILIFDKFILDRIDRELLSLERLELKFGYVQNSSSKYLLESFLMCSFMCSGFVKRLLSPGISIHDIFKLRRHLDTETYGRLPWQFCNFTCEITNYR